MVDRDEKRNRMAMARETRYEISRLNREIEDHDTEEDEQEHTHEIGREGLKVNTSENDENESNSETESIDTIEYEYENKNEQVKPRSEEENEEIEMTDNDEKKGLIKEVANSTLTDTKRETANQPMRQNAVEFVSIQQSPPRRLSRSSQRSPPSSARG